MTKIEVQQELNTTAIGKHSKSLTETHGCAQVYTLATQHHIIHNHMMDYIHLSYSNQKIPRMFINWRKCL